MYLNPGVTPTVMSATVVSPLSASGTRTVAAGTIVPADIQSEVGQELEAW